LLEEGKTDHGHQRTIVEAAPRADFELIEAQFFLELLVGLLAGATSLRDAFAA
jgi:hypothetical protein